jgi:hypothetical protein
MLTQQLVVSAQQGCRFVACGVEGPPREATRYREVDEVIDLTIAVSAWPRQAETAEARCRRNEVIAFP